jgi:hypothetical protein
MPQSLVVQRSCQRMCDYYTLASPQHRVELVAVGGDRGVDGGAGTAAGAAWGLVLTK